MLFAAATLQAVSEGRLSCTYRRWTVVRPKVGSRFTTRVGLVEVGLVEVGLDRAYFKTRVRRLKALGLTESLEVGYQLSPRGAAYLQAARGGR